MRKIVGVSVPVVLLTSLILVPVNGSSNASTVSSETKVYRDYNHERVNKLALEKVAENYEVNAILMASGIKQWNALGDSNGNVQDSKPLGKYENLDKLFQSLGDNRDSHSSYYKKYMTNDTKPIEQQEDLQSLTNLDYLSVSNVTVSYYYDSVKNQLSQVVRIVGDAKVYRCTVIYDSNGKAVNYFSI